MHVPNLRSPGETVGGIVYFGRMVDKIRLHGAGQLPEDYAPNLGTGFDGRCCNFLGIAYPALVEEVRRGGSDDALLDWAFTHGNRPGEEAIEVWNEFMRKRGWNDSGSPQLAKRKQESGFSDRAEIQTFFAYIDADEGR